MTTPWWRHGSVYQVYVRSFADSNGDGIGDLGGLTERLEHIASLGVDAIWLNPCFPSPQRDHGYDVSDYFAIEPDYGDLSTFDALVAKAHRLGLRVLLDVVPNHCSSDHPWFQSAIAAGPGSLERERFWFRPGSGPHGGLPPNNWKAIFGGSAWTRITEPDGSPGEWYLGVFTPHQPDWNFSDPAVVDHFERMLTFWFDRGVDGFRADAVIYLGKEPGLPDAPESEVDSPLNPMYTYVVSQHEVWRSWRSLVDRYQLEHNRELLLVAEAFAPDNPGLMTTFANENEFHQAFAFDLMLSAWRSDRIRETIEATLDALRPHDLLPAWTLNNHDTQRSASRYGRADATELGGFHDGAFRISDAPIDATLGLRRSRAAALLELALPGCVYLYAGEELGLPEVLDLPASARQDPVFHTSNGQKLGRDGCRVPIPWTGEDHDAFGFCAPDSTTTSWLPCPTDWGELSVAAQDGIADSTLEMYRTAGRLRRDLAALRSNAFEWVDGIPADLVAFRRDNVLVVCNPTSSVFALSDELIGRAALALSSVPQHRDPCELPANCTAWFVL